MSDFMAKMHQIRFPLGLRPRSRWGILQRSPDPLARLRELTSKGREGGEGKGGKGKGGKGWKGKGGERKGGKGKVKSAAPYQASCRRLC